VSAVSSAADRGLSEWSERQTRRIEIEVEIEVAVRPRVERERARVEAARRDLDLLRLAVAHDTQLHRRIRLDRAQQPRHFARAFFHRLAVDGNDHIPHANAGRFGRAAGTDIADPRTRAVLRRFELHADDRAPRAGD
jgi:hypothetical protein